MFEVRSFGVLADGRQAHLATLSWPGGLTVQVLDYGAAVHSVTVPVAGAPLQAVLNHQAIADYEADTAYLGPVVGRCANRIGGACFDLDGQTFHLSANEGRNILHGGAKGFNKRLWAVEAPVDTDDPQAASVAPTVALTYVSPDGEEGFPGRVEAQARYTLVASDTLEIAYSATCDRATAVNLSQHLYFNLSGDPRRDVLDHEICVSGDAITPVGPDLIPTGEFMPVDATPFDLRRPRRLGEVLAQSHPQLAIAKGLDHNWALSPPPPGAPALRPALQLRAPASGLTLEIATDQPGLQVYSGQGLAAPFVKHGAIVFEPQGFPDAVNQPDFPSVILQPGQTYRRTSTYRFQMGAAG